MSQLNLLKTEVTFMHQILGLRTYFDVKSQKHKKVTKFLENNWRAESLSDVLLFPEKYLELIPEGSRYNIFVTLAKCHEGRGRVLAEQNVIPFDIDEIDHDKIDEYTEAICKVLKIDYSCTGFISTGNGLHVLIGITLPILDNNFFERNRVYYKHLCIMIEKELRFLGLPFKEVDPCIFASGFSTRLPGTENRKDGRDSKPVRLIQSIISNIDFDLRERSGMEELPEGEALTEFQSSQLLKELPADSDAVLTQCPFLVYASTTIGISERQWYNALNIVSHLSDGYSKCHDISKHDPRYSHAETQSKAEQAFNKSGPMKCSTICNTWEGCKLCPHYNNPEIKSPIQLVSADFVATKNHGFRFLNDKGNPGKIDFEGLVKTYFKENHVVSLNKNTFYLFNGKFWEFVEVDAVAKFCHDKVKSPTSRPHEWDEFVRMIRINSIKSPDFFQESTTGYLNFENGVLKLGSWSLVPHSHTYGFTSVIPFPYIPEATAPLWEATIAKVTLNRANLGSLLQEYFGYCLAGSGYKHHKALVMTGSGRNGKSTLMETFMYVIGKGNYSSLAWEQVVDPEKSSNMRNKLVNFSEEVGKKEFINVSAKMKNLIGGGEFSSRKLYSDAIQVKNKTKFILACNTLPMTNDTTEGFMERLILVPFGGYFTSETDKDFDGDIKEKLKLEASGILNWIIQGYQSLEARGKFLDSGEANRILQEYNYDNNPLIGFFDDCIKLDTKLLESSDDLYKGFQDYCRNAGVISFRRTSFLREVEKLSINRKHKLERVRTRIYEHKNAVNCYKGLCLISNLDRQSDNF